MVHIPDEDEKETGQHRRPPQRASQPQRPAAPPQRTPTGQNQRPPTGQNQRPPTDQNRAAPAQRKTAPVQKQQPKQRQTGMLSLEPPKRNRGPSLGQTNARMDGMGGPATRSQRNRVLFGGIGREKSGQTDTNPVAQGGQSAAGARPTLRKPGQSGSVDLGSSAKDQDNLIVRRKGTRRIPKKGGGFEGEASVLESMGSGRRPAVDPGPQQRDQLPPVVDIPVPQQPSQKSQPPDARGRGNTLAGVSAEDLLGDEGRQLLENIRRREAEAHQQPQRAPAARPQPPQPRQPRGPISPLPPRMQDSSRMAFQSAEYTDAPVEEVAPDDELAPQGSFLSGPTRQIQREVVQTPMPVEQGTDDVPPPDDLGYERPVDFGEASDGIYTGEDGGSEEEPVARDSAAQDEMEQRAGYLLWLQGVITREEVEDALTTDDVPDAIRDFLGESAFADQTTLYRFLARHESVAPVDLEQVQPTERALASLRPAIARAYRVIPIEKLGELLLVAAAFPFDPKRLLELRRLTASKVKLFVVTEEEIDIALMKYYPGGASSAATLRSPKPPGLADELDDDSSITGEGDALEGQYDPTLSGEDSGLYAPIDSGPDDTNRPPSDVGLSEVEDGDADYETSAADVDDMDDLDESTLNKNAESGAFGNAITDPDVELPDELKQPNEEDGGSQIDTGPEELDPFA